MIRENIKQLKVLNERWILKESGGTKDVYLDGYDYEIPIQKQQSLFNLTSSKLSLFNSFETQYDELKALYCKHKPYLLSSMKIESYVFDFLFILIRYSSSYKPSNSFLSRFII